MLPEKTHYLTQGTDGLRRLAKGPDIKSYRGLNIINSRVMSMEDGAPPRDILRRRVRVAEYHRIPWEKGVEQRSFAFYDESKDAWQRFSWKDLYNMSLIEKGDDPHKWLPTMIGTDVHQWLVKDPTTIRDNVNPNITNFSEFWGFAKHNNFLSRGVISETGMKESAQAHLNRYNKMDADARELHYDLELLTGLGDDAAEIELKQQFGTAVEEGGLISLHYLAMSEAGRRALYAAVERLRIGHAGDVAEITGSLRLFEIAKTNAEDHAFGATWAIMVQIAREDMGRQGGLGETMHVMGLIKGDGRLKGEPNIMELHRAGQTWMDKTSEIQHGTTVFSTCIYTYIMDRAAAMYLPKIIKDFFDRFDWAGSFPFLVRGLFKNDACPPVAIVHGIENPNLLRDLGLVDHIKRASDGEMIELVIIRPNIEHNMLGVVLGRGGLEDLGATLWGQTELSVYDDSQHGIWGMSYKYNERAMVYNEKNLIRLWDIAYDGMNGGKDCRAVDWTDHNPHNPNSLDAFRDATYDLTKPYEGPSMMCMSFHNVHNSDVWPSPILFRDNGVLNRSQSIVLDGEHAHTVDMKNHRVFHRTDYADNYKKYMELMPDFQKIHNVKNAGSGAQDNESVATNLAFQGSHKVYTAEGSLMYEVTGNGHHGADYVGAASIRSGKGYRAPMESSMATRLLG